MERRRWSSGARQTAKDSSGVRGAAAEKKCSISAPIDSLRCGERLGPSASLSPRSGAKLRLKLRLKMVRVRVRVRVGVRIRVRLRVRVRLP